MEIECLLCKNEGFNSNAKKKKYMTELKKKCKMAFKLILRIKENSQSGTKYMLLTK